MGRRVEKGLDIKVGVAWMEPRVSSLRSKVDLVTRNSVTINAAPEVIWPYILNVSSWKAGASITLVSGAVNEVGTVYRTFLPENPDETLFYSVDVELTPLRRRTIKLVDPQDGILNGYASWSLEAGADVTTLIYEVLCQLSLEEASRYCQDKEYDAVQAEYQAESLRRFQGELETLKGLVERQ